MEGLQIVGNTANCHIKLPELDGECFILNSTRHILWLKPMCVMSRFDGLNNEVPLEVEKEYEIDVSTGPKMCVVQGIRMLFQRVVPKMRIKVVKLEEEKKQKQDLSSPQIMKRIKKDK